MGQLEQGLDQGRVRPKAEVNNGLFSDAYAALEKKLNQNATGDGTVNGGPTPTGTPQQSLANDITFGTNANVTDDYAREIKINGDTITLLSRQGLTETFRKQNDNTYQLYQNGNPVLGFTLTYDQDPNSKTYGDITVYNQSRSIIYDTVKDLVADPMANGDLDASAFVHADGHSTIMHIDMGTKCAVAIDQNFYGNINGPTSIGWELNKQTLMVRLGQASAILSPIALTSDDPSIGIFVAGSKTPLSVADFMNLSPPQEPSGIQFKSGTNWYVVDSDNSSITQIDTTSGPPYAAVKYSHLTQPNMSALTSQTLQPDRSTLTDLPKNAADYKMAATPTMTPTVIPTATAIPPTDAPTATLAPSNGTPTFTPTDTAKGGGGSNGDGSAPMLPIDLNQPGSTFQAVTGNLPKGVTQEFRDGMGDFEFVLTNGDVITKNSNNVSAAFDAAGHEIGIDSFAVDSNQIAKGNIDLRFTTLAAGNNPAVEIKVDQSGNTVTTFNDGSSQVDYADGTTEMTDASGAVHIKARTKHGRHKIDVANGQTTVDGAAIDGAITLLADGSLQWTAPAGNVITAQTLRVLSDVEVATYDDENKGNDRYTLNGTDYYVSSSDLVGLTPGS